MNLIEEITRQDEQATLKAIEEKWGLRPDDLPDDSDIEEWMSEGGAEAIDGCWTEADGHCPHGHPSWLLALGWI